MNHKQLEEYYDDLSQKWEIFYFVVYDEHRFSYMDKNSMSHLIKDGVEIATGNYVNKEGTKCIPFELCERCGRNPVQELHTCPYQVDMFGDTETLCNCCHECEGNCCQDV